MWFYRTTLQLQPPVLVMFLHYCFHTLYIFLLLAFG